jgi:gliding motility-associated-like protein
MKKVILWFFFTINLLGIQMTISGQPVVNFIFPDTSCVGSQINITNLTTGGTTFYWDFCSGNANTTPIGINIGNPGNSLHEPAYITLVQDSTDCFSFVTNQGNPTHITRYYHGSSFRNNPISWTDLATSATSWEVEGIQIKKDNGNWYGFENYNMTILRLDFGPSLWNSNPTVTDLGITAPISVAHGLIIIKEGNTWLGFLDATGQDELFRLNFGTSLTNIPTLEDLGNLGSFSHPTQIVIQQENGIWYLLIPNYNTSTISRINFGNSLLNLPTGSNLGNLGSVQTPHGITYIDDCETSSGYFTVYQTPGSMGKLDFIGGIGGTVTAQMLGNIGILDYPVCFSEIFRQNDSLFSYVTNWNSATITQLSFPPCNNSSIPSSNQFTPPLFSYNQPGTYHVRLQVDASLPDKAFLCKSIVIVPTPVVDLGPDRSICPGQTTTCDAGSGFSNYLWSTGSTFRTITVSKAGTYSVTVTQGGCSASDSVNISLYPFPIVEAGPDQSIPYNSTTVLNGSFTGSLARYSYSWRPSALLTNDTILNPGTTNLTHDTMFILTVTDLSDDCQGVDSVRIKVFNNEINEDCLTFHNVITPNGDGLNDKWIIDCIENFPDNKVAIFNRWGDSVNSFKNYDNVSQVWKGTTTDGNPLPDGTYYYVLTIKNGGKYCGWILLRGISK